MKMQILTMLKTKLRPVFEETVTDKDIKLWPFILWLFISSVAGFYGSFSVTEGYRLIVMLVFTLAAAAILLPILKLSVKKQSNDKQH